MTALFLKPTTVIPVLTDRQLALLKKLEAAFELGASAREFRGRDKAAVRALGQFGLARSLGTSWRFWGSSSFWSITDAGREFLAAARSHDGG